MKKAKISMNEIILQKTSLEKLQELFLLSSTYTIGLSLIYS